MDMKGESRIEAPQERVWRALNDAEILKASIAGCEELEKTSDTEFTAKVRAKVGPVSARFAGRVTLTDLDPPNGYRIQGEGTGGAAGFAKGGAVVTLVPEGSATILRYDVQATVGGKLAQIGSRLIDGTARKMADDFFGKFKQQVEAAGNGSAPGGPEAGPAAAGGAATTPEPTDAAPAEPRVPIAGATVDTPAAPPDLPVAPEVVASPSADLDAGPSPARPGPSMARAETPSRSVVQPELDATPGVDPSVRPLGPLPNAAPSEVPRDSRPTSDRTDGSGRHPAGSSGFTTGRAVAWGAGALIVLIVIIMALT